MKSEDINSPIFKLAEETKIKTNSTDLIITVSNGNPIHLYLYHRKGWVCFTVNLNKDYITGLKNLGAKYLIGEKSIFKNEPEKLNEILSGYDKIVDTDIYFILKL